MRRRADNLNGRLDARLLDFRGAEEDRVFDETAEFLLADVMMRTLARGEVFEGLVFHFQALKLNDLKVKLAFIPNLALLQFHRREDGLEEIASGGHPLPRMGEKGGSSALFEGGLFGGDFLFSPLFGAVGHGLFLGRHLLVRFWGFITHDVLAFGFELTGRRHESFSAGDRMVPAGRNIVNDAAAPSGRMARAGNPRGCRLYWQMACGQVGRLMKRRCAGGHFRICNMLTHRRFGIIRQNSCEKTLLFARKKASWRGLLDSLSLSRHGKSSGELSSVMILNPKFGNSLVKDTVSLGQLNIT
jgi:hypothetical protein